MSEDSEPRQLESSSARRELLALGLTESDGEIEHFQYRQALELCRLLLSTGHPKSVTNFQVPPKLVGSLCSIPNSPIYLTGDGVTVTLSREFLSNPASFACSLGVPENILFEQIQQFLDSRSPKPKRNGLVHIGGNEEQEELQLMPLPKRSRREESVMNNCCVMDNRANNITAIANGSMLEVLKAFESQASRLMDQSKHNTFPDFDSYTIVEEEGSGGYGIVYKAKRKTDGTEFAIKCPHAGAQKYYVNNEIRMLERFGGKNFIIKHEGCLKNGDSDCIILEHLEHDRPDSLKREIDVYQLQLYGYCMFKALSSLHKQGVVHRDVKPGNFLFSRKTNRGYLIDFNLAMDLHQKYRRADKSKAALNLPTASKKHHTLVKTSDATNGVTNKSSQRTLAPNSLKKAAGKIKARNDMSRWERFNSQGAEGSGLTSAKDVTSTRNNPSGEKRREPLPSHGRKELLNFLQESMSGPNPNHKVTSKAPTSMRKRVAALPGKTEKELLYLTPMPLRSNGRPEAGDINQKKDGPCSGTKGFRAPEVCFRSLYQGPKLDMWSAGVTLLYLMLGRAPFTGDPEQNIKDIAQLRGSEELWEVAKLHNRESSFPEELYESRYLKGMELRKWCQLNTKRRDFLDAIPRSLLDLVEKCLTVNPRLRISAEDALKHDFFHPVHEILRKTKAP